MWSRVALATAVSIPHFFANRINMNSSAVLAKLKEWDISKAAIGVSVVIPDVPGSLLIFAEEGPDEAATISLDRDDAVLSLSSGDLRLKLFLSAALTIVLEDEIGNGREPVSITFPGGKLRLWKR
jgi:hypothetical protein